MGILDAALETIRAMIALVPADGAAPNWPRPARPGGIPVLVAGSGEQRLLRVAARYADLVNLSFPSGDTLERIPHKLDVLRRHCHTVGRDPATVAVTYKAVLSVASSGGDAPARWEAWRGARGIGDVGAGHGVFVGEPDQVVDQLGPWLEAGIDQIIFELPDGHDPKSVALAGEMLATLATG